MMRMTAWALAALVLSAVGVARASLVDFESLDEVAPRIKVAFVAKVDQVVAKDEVREFKNGRKVVVGKRFAYKVKVTRVIAGEQVKAGDELTVEHATPLMAKYDDEGNVALTVSLILPGTGLENDLKVGDEYVLCFGAWMKEPPLRLVRAEVLAREPIVAAALREQEMWSKAREKLESASQKVRLSAFDPVTKRLALVVEDGPAGVLYVLSPDAVLKLPRTVKLEGDQLRLEGEAVKLRSAGRNVHEARMSELEPVRSPDATNGNKVGP